MLIKWEFTFLNKLYCILSVLLNPRLVLWVLVLMNIPSICLSQEEPQFDEVSVYLNVPGIGSAYIPAIVKNEIVYLSVSDVFTLLKIKNSPSSSIDSISGFFINPQDEYLIDNVNKLIIFQKRKIELKPNDLIVTETDLYMKISLFGDVFGLNSKFFIENLSVELTTKIELPTIREIKMEQMRENLKRLKGEVKTDTIIGRNYPLFNFGMADWRINTFQQVGVAPTTQLNLALGSVVASGEMNMGLNIDQSNRFDIKQQTYLWRYVNNEYQGLRQVLIGKLAMQTISSLYGQVVGVQLTNTPTTYRRSFGTYTLSNVTEPGWLVELYINGVLIDYVKSDASGFYKFEVPMTYGNSILKTRMIGPWGEIREKVENTNVPFTFLPPGEFEYATTLGVIEDEPNTKISRTNFNYGLSRRMSIGGGYEYFSSPQIENSIPFIGSSVFMLKNLLLAGEYAFGIRLKGTLSYHLPSSIQFDLNYTNYEKGQKAVLSAPLNERGVSIAFPIRLKHLSTYSSFTINQRIFDNYQTTDGVLVFSANLNGVSSNVMTSLYYVDPKHINSTSNVSFSFLFPKHITLRPSAQYDYNQKRWTSTRWQMDKPLLKNGYLNISYNKDFVNKMNNIFTVGLRYDFSFMQTDVQSNFSKNINSYSQSANGSLLFDRKSHYVRASNYSMVGKSGLTFFAFLDLNGNGMKDDNEPKISDLNIRINGGRILKRDKDSTIRVIDLVPYTTYLVELDNNSFKNIAWKIKKTALSVYADPNQFKTIAIPVEINSEAAGTVNYQNKNGSRGLGRIYVNFYRKDKTLFGRILTESDGYYSFMGLKPGDYIAQIDTAQLASLRMTAKPGFKPITVKESREGDFLDGLDFTLQSNSKDTTEIVIPKIDSTKSKITNYASIVGKQPVVNDINKSKSKIENNIPTERSSQPVAKTESKEPKFVTSPKNVNNSQRLPDNNKLNATIIRATDQNSQFGGATNEQYSVQLGEYHSETDALKDQREISIKKGLPSIIVLEEGVYKLWIEGFKSRRDARTFLASMGKMETQVSVDQKEIVSNNFIVDSSPESKTKPVSVNSVNILNPGKDKNQLIDYTDSIANIFKFEPAGSKTRGFPDKIKQSAITNIDAKADAKPMPVNNKPIPSTVISVNQNAQISVVNGQKYAIEIDGFIFDKSATAALRRISTTTNLPIIIVIKKGFYNLMIEGFASRKEAKLFEEKLAQMGFKGSIIRGNS
jgi:hypothetical protein